MRNSHDSRKKYAHALLTKLELTAGKKCNEY